MPRFGSTLGGTNGAKGVSRRSSSRPMTQPRPRTWREGKFVVKSSGWDENRIFLDDKIEVAVKNGGWVMTICPPGRHRNQRQSNTTSRRSRWRVTVTEQRQSDVVT